MLCVRDLDVVYGSVLPALRGVSLTVPPGRIIALLGANGAGKTTVLRAVSGLLGVHGGAVTRGEILLDGRPLHRRSPATVVRRGVSQVMEGRCIFGHLTVEENLLVGAHTRPRGRREALDRVYTLLPLLARRRRGVAGYLSGGEQQLLAMGRALMSDPRYLLLDEPCLGLGPRLVERLRDLIVGINRAGSGVLLVEQNTAMALSIAERGYVLRTGAVLLDKPAAELLGDDGVRQLYLGLRPDGAPRAMRQRAAVVASGRSPPPAPPRVAAGPPILRVSELRLAFAGVTAIDGLSFTVDRRELLAVVGPNGAGKTSVLNVISGVCRPQSGRVVFDDVDLVGRRPHQIAELGVARTFQNVELFGRLTVLENLMLGRHRHLRYPAPAALLRVGRARRAEIDNRAVVEGIVDLLDLRDWRNRPVGLLPYGVRKRVELGRALAMRPRLLLLDEPAAGMNRAETERMARCIIDVHLRFDLPVVLVAHDLELVADLADRVLVLDFGTAIAAGTPAQVWRDPEVVRAYLGPAGRP